jgi:hypothetical protein
MAYYQSLASLFVLALDVAADAFNAPTTVDVRLPHWTL